jgi:RNA polymerase sigma factor (TIGR02999 family)
MGFDSSEIVSRLSGGDQQAVHELTPLLYVELRALAERHLRRPSGTPTLQPTALVHEVFLKLAGGSEVDYLGRTHFFAVAASAMRQVLIDHVRGNNRRKRGGDRQRVTLTDVQDVSHDSGIDFDDLEDALAELGRLDERAARIVELRFFGGLTEKAAADILGISERTLRYDWRMARAWLRRRLNGETGAPRA